MLKYTEDHEWLQADGDEVIVGITAHASEQLGDVVFVELPEVGREVARGEEIVVIESVKAASDIYMPVAGEVVEVNEQLRADPSLANTDPMGAGWFFKLKLANAGQADALMDEAAYNDFTKA